MLPGDALAVSLLRPVPPPPSLSSALPAGLRAGTRGSEAPLGRRRQPALSRRSGKAGGPPWQGGDSGPAAVCVRCDESGRLLGSNRLNSVFTVFQMAAVTMGFGDPLSPLQSVNRNAHFFRGSCP